MSAPIRATVLTAPSTDIQDIMTTVWSDIGANSTWTQVAQYNGGGAELPGWQAFAIRSPSGDREINFYNDGASVTNLWVGINPDGGSDPIVDPTQPWNDAANFSGASPVMGRFMDLSATVYQAIGNAEFILLEWSDAIMLLFKDAARTYTPKAIHVGQCLVPLISALADPGGSSQLRIDGNAILGVLPDGSASSYYDHWHTSNSSYPHSMVRRVALGQSLGTSLSAHTSDAWIRTGKLTFSASQDSDFKYGALSERVPEGVILYPYQATNRSSDRYVYKYIRNVPAILSPFGIFTVGGSDRYMVVGMTATNRYLAVPIPDGFNPNP